MNSSIITAICIMSLATFIWHRGKEISCQKFNTYALTTILNKTVNLIHNCDPKDSICVNSAQLFRQEQEELLNFDLKEMGCK